MTGEHNGNSYVNWRDLEARLADRVTHRELDQRFKGSDKINEQLTDAAEKALLLAREGVLKHDVDTNNFRKQIEEERLQYAKHEEVSRLLEKLELELKSIIEINKQERQNEVANLRKTLLDSAQSIRVLENAASTLKGRDLGMLALGGSIFIAVMSFISPVIRSAIFGS